MADLKDALEARWRTFEPEPGGYDRLVRRRRNREVRRRVGAGVLAAAIAILAMLGLQTAFKSRPQQTPSVMPSNVASLRQVWSAQLLDIGSAPSAPVIAGDLTFVIADKLYAFPTSCPGSGSCAPAWTGDVGGASNIVPSVGDGVVVTTSPRRLSAFPVSCAAPSGTCAPLWTATAPGPGASTDFSGTVIRAGWVYATATDGLHVFPLHCRSDAGACTQAWFGRGSGSLKPPVVADDMVIVFRHPQTVAYPVVCSHASCPPLWKGVVRVSNDFDQPGTAIDGNELIIGPSAFLRTRRLPLRLRWIARTDRPDPVVGVTVAGGRLPRVGSRLRLSEPLCHRSPLLPGDLEGSAPTRSVDRVAAVVAAGGRERPRLLDDRPAVCLRGGLRHSGRDVRDAVGRPRPRLQRARHGGVRESRDRDVQRRDDRRLRAVERMT